MKDPRNWNQRDLHARLQHAIDLEFWTIPIYMTALYSIKGLIGHKPENYPIAGKLVFSVIVQEMLHLELICNIANALGHRPKFKPPVYDHKLGIPFIQPSKEKIPRALRGYSVQLRELNKESLRLFCVVEFPEELETSGIDWETKEKYMSIAEMYYALSIGIEAHWERCFVGEAKNLFQKDNFSEYRSAMHGEGFSQPVTNLATAKLAIEAIVEQGEGATAGEIPNRFRPIQFKPGGDYFADMFDSELCHYRKFYTLFENSEHLPPVYSATKSESSQKAKSELMRLFATFLKDLEVSFSTPGPDMASSFWKNMGSLPKAIVDVWESGACPQWTSTS